MLLALLTTTVSSPTGEGVSVGVHGGGIRVHNKKTFADKNTQDHFNDQKRHNSQLKNPQGTVTAVNGLLGVHVKCAKRIHDKPNLGVGGVVEVDRIMGENLMDYKKDVRYSLNILGRIMHFFSRSLFFMGAEGGFSLQQIKTPQDTRWPMIPLIGGFFGVGLDKSQKIVLSANLRYGLPTKQTWDQGIDSKPSSVSGTMGLSYCFS